MRTQCLPKSLLYTVLCYLSEFRLREHWNGHSSCKNKNSQIIGILYLHALKIQLKRTPEINFRKLIHFLLSSIDLSRDWIVPLSFFKRSKSVFPQTSRHSFPLPTSPLHHVNMLVDCLLLILSLLLSAFKSWSSCHVHFVLITNIRIWSDLPHSAELKEPEACLTHSGCRRLNMT